MYVFKRGMYRLGLFLIRMALYCEISNANLEFLSLDGRKEPVHFDKITSRIQKLCYGLNMEFVDPVSDLF